VGRFEGRISRFSYATEKDLWWGRAEGKRTHRDGWGEKGSPHLTSVSLGNGPLHDWQSRLRIRGGRGAATVLLHE